MAPSRRLQGGDHMAVTDRPIEVVPSTVTPVQDTLPGLLALASSLWQRPSVQRLGCSSSGSNVDFWVLTPSDDAGETEYFFSVKRDHQQGLPSWLHIGLHVVPLDAVREENLPHFQLLYQR